MRIQHNPCKEAQVQKRTNEMIFYQSHKFISIVEVPMLEAVWTNIHRCIDVVIYRYVIYSLMHGQKWLEPDELLTRRQIHVLSSCLMHGRKCLEPDELH